MTDNENPALTDFDGDSVIGYYTSHKPAKVKKGRRKHYPNARIKIITYILPGVRGRLQFANIDV